MDGSMMKVAVMLILVSAASLTNSANTRSTSQDDLMREIVEVLKRIETTLEDLLSFLDQTTTVRSTLATDPPTDPPTKPLTEPSIPPSTELPTESSTELPSDSSTDPPTEYSTDPPTESSTEPPTESSTELPTDSSTELPTEYSTDLPTEYSTELPTEYSTDLPTEYSTDLPTDSSTEPPTESSTDPPTEYSTDLPTESSTEPPTESSTELPTEYSTDPPTESSAEPPTESSTELPTESSTEPSTESSTEPPTDSSTELPTEYSTDLPTDSSTKPPTESSTEQPTELSTEPPNESSTEPSTELSTGPSLDISLRYLLSRSLLSVRTEENICVPKDSTDENDLCVRLTQVMNDIEHLTEEVNNGTYTQDIVDGLNRDADELDAVLSEIEKDPKSVDINEEVMKSEVTDLNKNVNEVVDKIDNQLNPKSDPTLAIVLGTIGGIMVLALVGAGGYVFYKKKQNKKIKRSPKNGGEDIPVKTFLNQTGQDNPSYQVEPGVVPQAPSVAPPQSRPSSKRQAPRTPDYLTDDLPSACYERNSPSVHSKSTPSGHYSSTPMGPSHQKEEDLYIPPQPAQYPCPGNQPRQNRSQSPRRPPATQKPSDPYSLQGRGQNVHRINTGSLLRLDP